MIYLVGGAPCVGKSVIARQLMKERGIPWLSTDALRSVFFAMAPKESRDKLFPYAGASDHDTVFAEPLDVIIKQQITEARSMKVGIHALMEFQIAVHEDLILEGVHILPEHVREFSEKHPDMKEHIHVLFVVDLDIDNAIQGLMANNSHFDWLQGAGQKTKRAVAEFSVKFSEYIKDEAEKNNFNVYEKTDTFTEDVKSCITLLG